MFTRKRKATLEELQKVSGTTIFITCYLVVFYNAKLLCGAAFTVVYQYLQN